MNGNNFCELALNMVREYIHEHTDDIECLDVYVVCSSWVFRSHMAIIMTNQFDGMLYKVTYNGDTSEMAIEA